MANLYSGSIEASSTYKTLAELTELTFTPGTTYTIQILNPAYIREGSTGNGFYIFNNKPFQYTAGADDLYIRVPSGAVSINIAD